MLRSSLNFLVMCALSAAPLVHAQDTAETPAAPEPAAQPAEQEPAAQEPAAQEPVEEVPAWLGTWSLYGVSVALQRQGDDSSFALGVELSDVHLTRHQLWYGYVADLRYNHLARGIDLTVAAEAGVSVVVVEAGLYARLGRESAIGFRARGCLSAVVLTACAGGGYTNRGSFLEITMLLKYGRRRNAPPRPPPPPVESPRLPEPPDDDFLLEDGDGDFDMDAAMSDDAVAPAENLDVSAEEGAEDDAPDSADETDADESDGAGSDGAGSDEAGSDAAGTDTETAEDAGSEASRSRSPRALRREIDQAHARVRWIETAELAELMTAEPPPLLLDVRKEAEFAVSHLEGAIRVDPDRPRLVGLPLTSGRTVIVYCSVGYRSAALMARLRRAGARDVRNLVGGLFQWANEGRPMVSARGRATRVHPYDAEWGLYLEPNRRAPLPDAHGSDNP